MFDYNDPIDTALIFNTIDAEAPTSQVLALPAESTNSFLVQWSGQDDISGSGIANYDIYVSNDGTNYSKWLDHTTATNAMFSGSPGVTYRFYSVARDNVGNEEMTPNQPDAITRIAGNAAPTIAPIPDQTIAEGQLLTFTITATDTDVPPQLLTFSLDAGSASGASIDPTSGAFHWQPSVGSAPSTNAFTVRVTDNGTPPQSESRTFNVIVRKAFSLRAATIP
jgi:hypothetical protein